MSGWNISPHISHHVCLSWIFSFIIFTFPICIIIFTFIFTFPIITLLMIMDFHIRQIIDEYGFSLSSHYWWFSFCPYNL